MTAAASDHDGRQLRVCIIHNIVSPYRLPLFEEIARSVDLTVVFCTGITPDRAWTYGLEEVGFRHMVLPGTCLGPVIVNHRGLRQVLGLEFDVVVVNNDPDVAVAAVGMVLAARRRGRAVLSWSEVVEADVLAFATVAYSDNLAARVARRMLVTAVARYRRFQLARADHCLVLSRAAATFLEDLGVSPERITHMAQVMPGGLMPAGAGSRTGRRFLYVGYLTRRKGVEHLIDAFRSLADPAAQLLIAGMGPTEQELRGQAGDDGRIAFLGYLEGQAKADLYARADVLVLPTLHDVWGLVVNEAMHYGLAVITTDRATAREIVGPANGMVVGAGSAPALAGAMAQLLGDPATLAAMQEHNRSLAGVNDVGTSAANFVAAVNAAHQAATDRGARHDTGVPTHPGRRSPRQDSGGRSRAAVMRSGR